MSVVDLLGSLNLTMGQGCKTGVSLLIPAMLQEGKTGVSLVGRSRILRRMVSADPKTIGCGLRGLGSGGFGGGRTPLSPDLTSQFPDQHSLIQAFMLVKFSVGMLLAFTWLFLFLQSEKQYFWRNQRGQQRHVSFHFGRLSACLLAFIAHISVESMHSLGWFSCVPLPTPDSVATVAAARSATRLFRWEGVQSRNEEEPRGESLLGTGICHLQ